VGKRFVCPPSAFVQDFVFVAADRNAGRSPPPCTSTVEPETYDASGEARNAHTSPISRGLASRPAGTVAPTAAIPSASP